MSTLMQLWCEITDRSPALVNPDGRHVILSANDCALLGCEIERVCMPPTPPSIVETLASHYRKTVTFDANQYQLVPKVPTDAMLDAAACASMQHLIDCIRDPEKLNEIGSEENVRKTHASRYHSMLAAAPTPAAQSADHSGESTEKVPNHVADSRNMVAAQSAGQEAFAWATHHDEPMLFLDREEAAQYCDDNETPIPLVKYAAPVNGAGQEACWAVYNGWSLQAFFQSKEKASEYASEMQKNHDLSGSLAAFVVKPLYATPVNGVERATDAQQVGGDAWPMLSDMHLLAITLAYNEGYSKAYDGREFENPFAQTGSQAAAWELGTRDGKEARKAALTSPAKEQK